MIAIPSPALFFTTRSRRVRLSTALLALVAALTPATCLADLPTPGGAPGSTTGDGARPFVGLAESPRAAAFTGAAVTSIAIEVPPGRAAATPRLELRYASSQGASAYGHGWSLPIARIVRSTRRGVPRYDASDTFTLETADGSVELVRVAGSNRFVPRNESAFARIGFDAARNAWRVIDKSGTTLVFGMTAGSRTGPDPTSREGTYGWLLTRWTDAAGNTIDYSYLPASEGQGSRSGLPDQVAYGGNRQAGVEHAFAVRFVWNPLPYPSIAPLSYAAGFAERRDLLLAAVETYAGSRLVRRYALSHEQDARTGASRLIAVSLDGFAADAAGDVALPSTVFTYSDSVTTGWPVGIDSLRQAFALTTPSPGAFHDVGTVSRFDTFDINGDGLVDWIDARPTVPVVRLGNGAGFAPPIEWPWPAAAPHKLRETDPVSSNLKINVFDLDGDGLADLVDAREGTCALGHWCVYRNTGRGFAASAVLWPAPQNNLREAQSNGNRVLADVADLNGDGRPDWIDASTHTSEHPYWTVHWNTGSGFTVEGVAFAALRDHVSLTRDVGSRKRLVYGLFDMNGDGLPDFINADVAPSPSPPGAQDHWNVHLNTGNGFVETPLVWTVEGAPAVALPSHISDTEGTSSLSVTYTELVDMNGDGRPDWLRPWTSADGLNGLDPVACEQTPACTPSGTLVPPSCCVSFLVFLNTGTSFAQPTGWAAWDPYRLRRYTDAASAAEREFELLDFDGDGLVDLVERTASSWRVFRHPASPYAGWSPLPPERRGAPDLLRSMLNGVGGETHIDYAPASTFRANAVPFPYWAVTARRIRDGVSDSPAGYWLYLYSGGAWAGAEREFRGFREVWETDGSRLTTATRFHQDTRLQGLVEEIETLGPAPCTPVDAMDERDACSPLRDTMRLEAHTWTATGAPLLASSVSTPYAADRPVVELARTASYVYDAFGNITREEISSPSAGAVITETSYAQALVDDADGMPSRYLVDKPVRTATRPADRSLPPLTEKRFVYDAANPLTGLLAESSSCVEWGSSACARWSTSSYRYDKAGNVVTVTGPTGGVTATTYDAFRLYARSVRNAVGHVTESLRDLASGRELRKRTTDGRVFTTDYDGLGRPLRSWASSFSRESPEVMTSYVEGIPGYSPGYVRTDQRGAAPVVVFFDGLGRRIATKTVTETAGGERTVVGGRAVYDAAGRLAAEGVTFESVEPRLDRLATSDASAPAWTRNFYDDHGRLIATILPDGSKTLRNRRLPGVAVTVFANLASGRHPGKAEIELRDGLERVWRKDVCSAAPPVADPTACPAGSLVERVEVVHDGLDRPLRITSAAHTSNPAVTEIAYDGLGNRTRFASADHGEWRYEYQADGLLARAIDPRGVVMVSQYDKIGRLRTQRSEGFKAHYIYHTRGGGAGQVRRIRTQSGSARVGKEFRYDDDARLVEEEISIAAGGLSLQHATRYEYDSSGRRSAVSYPGAGDLPERRVVTGYSRYGRPISLTAFDGSERHDIVTSASYDLLGNVDSLSFANGLTDVFVHDSAANLGRLVCLRTTRGSGAPGCTVQPGDERAVAVDGRDAAGNILTLDDYRHAPGTALDDSQAFTYDSLGRLTHSARASAPAETFSYDNHGNLAIAQGGSFLYASAAPHQPTLSSEDRIAHDAAGNRVRKGDWGYAYDALGRLSEVRHRGELLEETYYGEGRERVARFDTATGSLRYYVGGLFELDDTKLVRHYYLGGRIVASDGAETASARAREGMAGATRMSVADASRTPPGATALHASSKAAAHPARTGSAWHAAHPAASSTPSALHASSWNTGPFDALDARRLAQPLLLTLLGLLLLASALGPHRSGIALVTAFVFVVATTPRDVSARAHAREARPATAFEASTSTPTLYYHVDHVGSPALLSDHNGVVVEQRRYDAYGRVRMLVDESGTTTDPARSAIGYTGQVADSETGLIYFGARYYDPELGLFLTPDPQAEFASPYLYGGGNPVNGSDTDGEFFGFLFALLTPIIVSSAVSALVSGVSAALQGGDFLKSFTAGFVTALSGAALGTVIGGLNVVYQMAAGGAGFVELEEALLAAAEVASRASFTSAVTNAALDIADAAGVPADLQAALAGTTPLFASLVYDQYIVKESGTRSGATSQRGIARDGLENANTGFGHSNVTREAAQGTGWERYGGELLTANLAEDGPPASGSPLRDFMASARSVLDNQDHFGRLPASIRGLESGIDSSIAHLASAAPASDPTQPFRAAVGAATHYVQDHLTLGHMVPGTSAFGGPLGAPIRFVIHQVFGGEIAFRDAQIRATRSLLQRYPVIT